MIQPIGSMILGAIIIGEDPSALQFARVLVVLGAVVFATRRLSGRDRATALGAAG